MPSLVLQGKLKLASGRLLQHIFAVSYADITDVYIYLEGTVESPFA